jgi:predicted metal-binding membrane protein
MRRDNAELDHEAADRPSGASSMPTRDAARSGSIRMTALIRIDTQPGRERPLVIACLAMLVAICWACLVFRALRIATLDPISLVAGPVPDGPLALAPPPYRAPELVLVLAMWGAMLSAITLPAATPAVLLFAHINRLAQSVRFPNVGTLFFVAGYLAVWSGFGALATLAQWALHDAGALDTAMAIVNPSACGLMLVAAGIYQWTPAKHACLQHCRAPLSFVVICWRPGLGGALRMGCTHGLNCVGCCWLQMLLLFAAGVTNLGALLALAGLLLSEKLLPGGPVVACISGLALVAWGTLLLFP